MAVKVFRGEVSPDGQMADEVDIACALDHPNLTLCRPHSWRLRATRLSFMFCTSPDTF